MLASLLLLLAAAPPPDFQYGAAAVDLPAEVTPVKALAAWHALVVERGLAPDVLDSRDGFALGDWQSRPHVCAGSLRYHAVVAAEKTLRLYVVAECLGTGATLDRAALGLAEEMVKRLGGRGTFRPAKTAEVPQRLWEARTFRGNNRAPEAAAPAPEAH
ncbi:MAG: hypothetical protein HY904_02050 [Deltaproteobacteria bacterium]|nr:hypothetical protein [Deltaproteobacteria bacterium]